MATSTPEIQATEKRAGVFLTAHHVVLYVALAIAIGLGVYFVESKYADLQEARATAAEQALAVEKDHAAQLVSQFNTNEAKRQQEITQIYQTIAQIKSQAQVQIIHDKAAPAPEVGHRIETITGFQQGTIILTPKDELVVPLPVAHDIVARLDQGEADAKLVTQQSSIINTQVQTITEQGLIIDEDKRVLAATIDADKKTLNAEKAKARKSKLKWFAIGFVSGFVARGFTGH